MALFYTCSLSQSWRTMEHGVHARSMCGCHTVSNCFLYFLDAVNKALAVTSNLFPGSLAGVQVDIKWPGVLVVHSL